MPIVMEEVLESRRVTTGPNATAELRYMISGTSEDVEARTELLTATPATFDLYGNGSLLLNREYVGIEPVGTDRWLGVAYYARVRATGQQRLSFDTKGGTFCRKWSLQTMGRYPAGGADDLGGTIGQGDSGPEGVDVVVPVFNFSVQRFVPDVAVNGPIHVQCKCDGGSAGNATTACTYTYAIYTEGAPELTADYRLAEELTPQYGRTSVGQFVAADDEEVRSNRELTCQASASSWLAPASSCSDRTASGSCRSREPTRAAAPRPASRACTVTARRPIGRSCFPGRSRCAGAAWWA
ncbi:MAG: hypothetical protein PVJ57_19385 [Phycisphaerae bacterium]|jgi:hypothetical protein